MTRRLLRCGGSWSLWESGGSLFRDLLLNIPWGARIRLSSRGVSYLKVTELYFLKQGSLIR